MLCSILVTNDSGVLIVGAVKYNSLYSFVEVSWLMTSQIQIFQRINEQ